MITDFKGKTAFITGAASGIGLGMARAFGRRGMNIVAADINLGEAQKAAAQLESEQIKAIAVHCDVADRSSVGEAALKTISAFKKVHLVCNNAGVAVGGPIGQVKESDWDWIIDVNLKGVVHGVELFAPLILSHGEGGHIVNTASMAGMVSPPGMEPYSATKFAVVAMTEGWNAQLLPQGVGVSVLCPGYVRTHIHESGRERQARYGGPGEVDPGVTPQRDQARAMVEGGIDPLIVGERVAESVRDGDLYIFTHPNFRPFVEMRFEAIRAAFDAADRSEALKQVKEWQPVVSALQQPGERAQ